MYKLFPVASQAFGLVFDQFQLWVMGRAEISPISVCSVPRTPLDGDISSRRLLPRRLHERQAKAAATVVALLRLLITSLMYISFQQFTGQSFNRLIEMCPVSSEYLSLFAMSRLTIVRNAIRIIVQSDA